MYQGIIDTKKSMQLILSAIDEFKNMVDVNHTTSQEQTRQLLDKFEAQVLQVRDAQALTAQANNQELDRLASIVNRMEEHYKHHLPDYLKSVSLTADMTWASPTLLCLKLKEEYLMIEQEYNNLRSQLSQESNSYLSMNNQLKDQVRTLSHSLSDMTSKYTKEKEERERIMHSLMGKDKEAFDAVRFKSVLEENDSLKKQIEDLKFKLISEKRFKINQLFEDQEATSRINTLNQELNTLNNIKIELMSQIQSLNIAHGLQLTEKDREISYWQQENQLITEKMVVSSDLELFEQSDQRIEIILTRFG